MLWHALPLRAQESEYPSARVRVEAPSGCTSEEELAVAVSDRLGRRALVRGAAELVVRVRVQPEGEGYRAEVALIAAESGELLGTREIASESSDCRMLDDPLAVVLSLMLDVRREDLLPPPPLAPSPEPSAERWGLSAGALGALSLGLLPRPAPEVALFAGAFIDAIDLRLELALAIGERVPAEEGLIEVHAASARVIASPTLVPGPIALSLRAGAGLGPMWASASNVVGPRPTQVRPFFEVRAGLTLSFEIAGPLRFELTADASLVPLRPVFFLREVDGSVVPLFEPSLVTGTFGGGLTLRAR